MLLTPEIPLSQGLREIAVRFGTPETELAGNLVLPDTLREPGVVFIHGWSGVRSGPHGLLTAAARALGAQGRPTLRFDLHGRGESRGNGLRVDLPGMADDVRQAVNLLRERTGVRRVVLFGLCSGGTVAIGVLPQVENVAGLVLLSVYPFSDGDAFSRDVHRTWHFLRIYWHKLFQPETWTRLVHGDIHFAQIFNVLFGHYRKKNKEDAKSATGPSETLGKPAGSPSIGATSKAPGHKQSRPAPGDAPDRPPPRKHLENLRCGVPAVMLYGTADPDAGAAEEYYRSFAEKHGLPVEFIHIEGANHNFSSMAWKNEVIRHAGEFCTRLGADQCIDE